MRKWKLLGKRAAALLLGAVMAVSPGLAGAGAESVLGIVSYADERTASVNATNLNVRSGPGTSYQALAKLSKGAPVTVLGEQTGTDGVVWYQIRYSGSGGEQTGYVSSKYIKFPTAIKSDSDFESYLTKQGFPESYKQGLRELHAQYPNWTFTAFQTNLDWSTALKNESVIGRNLVASSSISSWKSTETGAYDWGTGTWPGFDGSSWVQASSDIIAYYMDPRNFLNDKYVYQFMKQSYDSSLHTKAGLQNMVSGTFLSGMVSGGSSVSTGTGSSSGSSSSGSATGPGSSSGSSGSSAGLSSPIASISDHKTEWVAATNGPGMVGDGFSSNNADGETAPVSNGTSSSSGNKSSGTASSTTGTTSATTNAPGSSTSGTTSGSTSSGSTSAPGSSSGSTSSSTTSGSTSAPGSSTSSSSGTSTGVAQQSASGLSYVDVIMNAASESGVNPYILASMILQEQGSQGTGRSISGTVSGYQGYYNFFNIEAYQSGSMSAVERGLWWASQSGTYLRPWNSIEKSIRGGSVYYGENYVKKGQDTLYLKKFNVQGSNLYKHQYMTNVQAAAAEGLTLSKITALASTTLEFSIPVYKNMPASACVKPTLDGSPNNKLSALGVDGFALTPTFNRDTESYDLIVDPSVASVTVAATAIDSKAVIAGTGTVDLQSGINEITVTVKAANGNLRNYVLHVVRQSGGPTYSSSIGSGVSSGSSSSGPATGPGMSSGSSSSGGSDVQIVGPTSSGSSSGSSSSGQSAPGSNVNGFGSSSSGTLIAPNGESVGSTGNPQGSQTPTSAAAPSQSTAGTTHVASSVRGDVNGDGKLNIMDVLLAQRAILGLGKLSAEEIARADLNGNGKVDILDVLLMQKKILGL